MLINKSNYEAFALDYLEGNLSATQVREMELFLAAQPAIAADLAAMRELITLEADTSIVFEPKHLLIKEEKAAIVFWMQPQFRQRVAAAAVALLLVSAGYFMGKKNHQLNDMPIANEVPTQENIVPNKEQMKQEYIAPQLANVTADETNNSRRTNDSTNTQTKTNKTVTPTTSQQKKLTTSSPSFDLAATTELSNTSVKEETSTRNVLKDDLVTAQFTEVIAAINPLPNKRISTVKSEITTIVYINDAFIETNKTGKRLRGLLGSLPFEDVKLANFVPTYYSDSVGE